MNSEQKKKKSTSPLILKALDCAFDFNSNCTNMFPPLFLFVLRLPQIAACNFCTAVPLGIKDVGLRLHNTVRCCCGVTQTCLYLLQYITS